MAADLPRRRASEGVYDRLRELVLENRLPPDERISIDAVARELGVSQTPVREAIRQLEGDRLVVRVPGKGYQTTPLLDREGLRDLFEFRLLVEVWAARAAAVNRLSNPAPMMRAELDRITADRIEGADIPRRLVTHDTRFHQLILSAAGNTVIEHAHEQTHTHLHTFRLYSADADGSLTLAEHSAICAAIEACDPDTAEAAMRAHLIRAYARFSQYFEAEMPPLSEGRIGRLF